jgi:hypothetical protein
MRFFIIVLLCLIFNTQAQYRSLEKLPNSCFINSVAMYLDVSDHFSSKNIWNNILIFQYKDPSNPRYTEGHAVCVFEFNNSYFAYDINQGSWMLKTYNINVKNNPIGTAKLICPKYRVLCADYLIK